MASRSNALTFVEKAKSTEWHGWSRGAGEAIHIGRIPGRKRVMIYLVEGSVVTTLGSFTSEEYAKKALDALDRLFGMS